MSFGSRNSAFSIGSFLRVTSVTSGLSVAAITGWRQRVLAKV